MKTIPISEQIRGYIKANPGTSNSQIAKALGIKLENVCSRTAQDIKVGKLVRKVAGKSITNAPIYAYYLPFVPVGVNVSMPVVADTTPVVEAPTPVVKKKKVGGQELMDLNPLISQLAASIAETLAYQIQAGIVDKLKGMLLAPPPPVESVSDILARIAAPPHPQGPQVALAAPVVTPVVTPPAPAPVLKKVVIVGLLPAQANLIRADFGTLFDLRFWKEGGVNHLRSMVTHAHKVFVWTSHISHKITDVIKTSGADIVYCNGGLSNLKDLLTELYVEEKV